LNVEQFFTSPSAEAILPKYLDGMKFHLLRYSALLWADLAFAASTTGTDDDTSIHTSYGVDVSFPILGRVSTNYPHLEHNVDPANHKVPASYKDMPPQPLGDRQQLYLNHLEGCRNANAPLNSYYCDQFEYDRMLMNRRQPQSMVNLTETGFKKIRSPPHLKDLIDDFWNKNKDNGGKEENWGVGNTYVNFWDAPTTLVSVDDTSLRGSGGHLKEHIWAAASAVLEEWTQQELQPVSLYGIRVYHEGAVMMPHIDRLPLVASAIINVAQDVDEPWPTVSSEKEELYIVVVENDNARRMIDLSNTYLFFSFWNDTGNLRSSRAGA
jgi:hypothetical protein